LTSKKKKTKKEFRVKVGEIYLAESFAGPKVYKKIVSIDEEEKGWYTAVLVRQKDIDALRDGSVPYPKNATPANIKPGTLFKFSIIKKIKGFIPEVKEKPKEKINTSKKEKKRKKFRSPSEIIGHVKKTK